MKLTDEELITISFALACRIDDFRQDILKSEARLGEKQTKARQLHADLCRVYAKINPESISGPWKLMDSSVIGLPLGARPRSAATGVYNK